MRGHNRSRCGLQRKSCKAWSDNPGRADSGSRAGRQSDSGSRAGRQSDSGSRAGRQSDSGSRAGRQSDSQTAEAEQDDSQTAEAEQDAGQTTQAAEETPEETEQEDPPIQTIETEAYIEKLVPVYDGQMTDMKVPLRFFKETPNVAYMGIGEYFELMLGGGLEVKPAEGEGGSGKYILTNRSGASAEVDILQKLDL